MTKTTELESLKKIKGNTNSFLEEINQIFGDMKISFNTICNCFESKMEELEIEEGVTGSQLQHIFRMKNNAASFKQEINDLMTRVQSRHIMMEREIVYNLYKMEKETKKGN